MEKTLRKVVFLGLVLQIIIMIAIPARGESMLDVLDKYTQEERFFNNIVRSTLQVLARRPKTVKLNFCILLSSPPGGRSLEIANILGLKMKTLVIINIWQNPEADRNETRVCLTCSRCEYVIILTSSTEIQKLMRAALTASFADAKLLVSITEVLENKLEAKRIAKVIVDLAWQGHLGYQITLVQIMDGQILALKSLQHMPFVRCSPEPPRVVGKWVKDKFFGDVYFHRLNYNKCVVAIGSGNCGFMTKIEIDSSGQKILRGPEGEMVQALSQIRNFSIKLIDVMFSKDNPEVKKFSTKWESTSAAFASGEIDMAACDIWMSAAKGLRFSASFARHYAILMVPELEPRVPFFSFTQTFSTPVWICLMATFVFARIFIRINKKRISSLMTLALFLGVAIAPRTQRFAEKCQIIVWVSGGYLLCQSYFALLASVLNSPSIDRISTIRELAQQTSIGIVGYSKQRLLFETDEAYRAIIDRYVSSPGLEYVELTAGKPEVLRKYRGMAVMVNMLERQFWNSKYYPIKEALISYPTSVVTKTPGTVSIDEIDRNIETLVESGLVEFWIKNELAMRKNYLHEFHSTPPSPALAIDEVAGIFFILIGGISISTIVFIYEICKK